MHAYRPSLQKLLKLPICEIWLGAKNFKTDDQMTSSRLGRVVVSSSPPNGHFQKEKKNNGTSHALFPLPGCWSPDIGIRECSHIWSQLCIQPHASVERWHWQGTDDDAVIQWLPGHNTPTGRYAAESPRDPQWFCHTAWQIRRSFLQLELSGICCQAVQGFPSKEKVGAEHQHKGGNPLMKFPQPNTDKNCELSRLFLCARTRKGRQSSQIQLRWQEHGETVGSK